MASPSTLPRPELVEIRDNVMRVMRDDHTADLARCPGLQLEQVVAIYRAMVRARIIDLRLEKLQRQGRIPFHVGALGEEGAIVASAAALRDQDWIVPCYREVGALLWRGYPLQMYIDHMYGNADDPAKGRQMPDHTVSREHRYLSVSAPIGTQIPHAVGLSWAARQKGRDEVAAVYFGDGATSSNDFHAALNFAGVFKTPTIFLCRNNGYAISLPSSAQTASDNFAQKGLAYGVTGVRVDGNDVLAVWVAVRDALRRASSGGGPSLIELITYRLGGHSTSDDPKAYRDEAEVEEERGRDPLVRLNAYLTHAGAWDDGQERAWVEAVESELKDCIARAEEKADPELSTLFNEVYAEQPQHLAEQEEELRRGPRAPKGH